MPSTLDLSDAPTMTPPTAPDALDFPPGHLFADRFTIVEREGQGGMGRVYKAIDQKLDLLVALKLIRPDLAGRPVFVERFKQEVRLTRQVTHPNVCRVHDLGESRGILYLSMEWVEGETLRRLLHQAGTLEEERALAIAQAAASALSAAHAKGIIHRDLKPENVMIDRQGTVFVMDFGIALGPGPATGTDSRAGTPAYMSPEQRRGDTIDSRSDLYSLGLILQEMLGGTTPSSDGGHPSRPNLPHRRTAAVLDRFLAERPEDRYPTAGAAAEEIARLREWLRPRPVVSGPAGRLRTALRQHPIRAAGAAGVLLAAIVLAILIPRPAPTPPSVYYQRGLHYLRSAGETPRSLGDATQMFHRALEGNPNLAVAYAGLGEGYWEWFRMTHEEILRQRATDAVDRALKLDPDLPEGRLARAVGYTVEGKYREARSLLERLVATNPGLDVAWEYLGTACRELGDYARGRYALQQAIRLRPGSFRHQIALGRFFERTAEYDEAARAYRKATECKPDSSWAWNNLGAMYLYQGKYDQVVPALSRALEIEEQGSARSNLGTAYYYQGKYEDAAANYRRATELEPLIAVNWGNLGDSLQMLGRDAESREAFRHAVQLERADLSNHPEDPAAHARLGKFCAKAADLACAQAEGDRAARDRPGDASIAFTQAIIQCAIGRRPEALDWLEKAVNLGLGRSEIENEPSLAPLRAEPRYRQILGLAS